MSSPENSIDQATPDFKEQVLATLKTEKVITVKTEDPRVEISITQLPNNRIKVTAREAVQKTLLGTISSPNEKESQHRPLKVEGAKAFGLKNSQVASQILKVINSIEGRPEIEVVPHYELIRFYILEGYVPVSRKNQSGHPVDKELQKLFTGLVEFQKKLNQGWNPSYDIWSLPKTILKLDPPAAKQYWNSILKAVDES